MNNKVMIFVIVLMLAMSAISAMLKTNEKQSMKEKNNPFECGFDPNHKMRASFSLRFFILTIIFLIFDVEVASILPIPICNFTSFMNMFIWNSMICLLLVMGMAFEWKQGALSWAWVSI